MSESFTLRSYIVAEVEVGSNNAYGTGRAELPVLVVNLRLIFRSPRGSGTSLDFREIRCRVSPFDATYIATSLPVYLKVRVKPGEERKDDWVHVEIPLDLTRLALINRLRNGGDVKIRLDLELLADEVVEVAHTQDKLQPSVWGLVERHHMQTKLRVVIPRSKWVEQVLPGMEFGRAHIMELATIPIESCAGVKAAFDALQQAQKLEGQGFYNEAVAKCRIALEAFLEITDKTDGKGGVRKVPTLKAEWQTRLGQRTYEWLNGSLVTVKQATNKSVHLSSLNFDQMEAQMLIIVTTALVAYAVKTQPES